MYVQYIPDPYNGYPTSQSVVSDASIPPPSAFHVRKPYNEFYHARDFGLTTSPYELESSNRDVMCYKCGGTCLTDDDHGHAYISGIDVHICKPCWSRDIAAKRVQPNS